MIKQVVLIHGGDPWESYEDYLDFLKNRQIDFSRHGLRIANWQENLAQRLGENFQLVRPEMPNKANAKYAEWKIWFEKFFPFLDKEVILVGGSLGGIFLAKYLAENRFPKKIKALFLLAAPFGDGAPKYSLADFVLPEKLETLKSQPEKVFLYHSEDDDVVPFAESVKYRQVFPNATVRIFEDRGHFNQEELPELVEDIKKL